MTRHITCVATLGLSGMFQVHAGTRVDHLGLADNETILHQLANVGT
jgi:hypothetical protein